MGKKPPKGIFLSLNHKSKETFVVETHTEAKKKREGNILELFQPQTIAAVLCRSAERDGFALLLSHKRNPIIWNRGQRSS